jgi:hypothetical protein
MAIYIRGDATPFILVSKSDDAGTQLHGYFSDEPSKVKLRECATCNVPMGIVGACTSRNHVPKSVGKCPHANTFTNRQGDEECDDCGTVQGDEYDVEVEHAGP